MVSYASAQHVLTDGDLSKHLINDADSLCDKGSWLWNVVLPYVTGYYYSGSPPQTLYAHVTTTV